MPFKGEKKRFLSKVPGTVRVGLVVIAWLFFISVLHYQINYDTSQRTVVRLGYMPVITNLAAPILDYASREGEGLRFTAVKFSSFAEMGEALRNGNIEAAFIIAPLAIVLRQQGEDVKVVYIGNRHESTLVVRKDLHATRIEDLANRIIAVPMRYSGHNLSIRQLARQHGLTGKLKVVEMNPPDMPAALASGALDAYYVGEPFAAKALKNGDARPLVYVEDVWPGFICNVMLVRQSFIDTNPELIKKTVTGAVRSGLWAKNNLSAAAEIAASYWNQSAELVEYALTSPSRERIVFDKYLPRAEEFQYMATLMTQYGLAQTDRIGCLVEDRFAREASLDGIEGVETIIPDFDRR
ncbi:MAG: hypothetical protein CSA20_07070 [Deltaproteobacteria bacterium]|nr:MAG: hypothetical protein CSA20_07070 [Deltaproteobacteria bacterium]